MSPPSNSLLPAEASDAVTAESDATGNAPLPGVPVHGTVQSTPDPVNVKRWLPAFKGLFDHEHDTQVTPSQEEPGTTNTIVVVTPPPDLHVAKGTPFSVEFRVPGDVSDSVVCIPEESLVEKNENNGLWTCTYDPKRGGDGWQTLRVGVLNPVQPALAAEWQVYYDNNPPVLDAVKYKKTFLIDDLDFSTAGNMMVSGLVTDWLPPQIVAEAPPSVWLKVNGVVKQVHFETESFFWAIIKTEQGWNSFEVFAEDSAFNTTSYMLPPLVVDKAPPTMTVYSPDTPDGALYGQDSLKIWVKTEDDSTFVPTVTMRIGDMAPVAGTPVGTGEIVEFWVSGFAGQKLATFEAVDIVGKKTTQAHHLLLDKSGPFIWLDLPLADGEWFNKTSMDLGGGVEDSGAGVHSVLVSVYGPNGYEFDAVVPQDEPKVLGVTLSGITVPLGKDGLYELKVTATDALGNITTLSKNFKLDTEAPAITQEPTYFIPELGNTTTQYVNGKLSMKPDGGQVTVLTESLCKVHCGQIVKHPNRLSYSNSNSVAQNNLPSFKIKTTGAGGSSMAAVKYSFLFNDGAATPEKTVPWGGIIPLSTQTIWGIDSIPDESNPLPTGLIVTAFDTAGNARSLQLNFDLILSTPPIPYEVVSPSPSYGPNPTTATLSFLAKNVHVPFDGGDDDMLTAARIKFYNPYEMPIAISLNGDSAAPKTAVKLKGKYYYLNGDDFTPNNEAACCPFCKPNTCTYLSALSSTGAKCQLPSNVDESVEANFEFALDDVVWHVLAADKYKTSMSSTSVVLLPGEVGFADLGGWTGWAYCTFPTPVNLAIQSKSGASGTSVSGMYLWSGANSCENPWPKGKTLLTESAWCTTLNMPPASDPCWKQIPGYCGSPYVHKRYIHAKLLTEVEFSTVHADDVPLFWTSATTLKATELGLVSQGSLGGNVVTNAGLPGKSSPF